MSSLKGDDFPDHLKVNVYPFLTVIPGRYPKHKVHTGIGQAKNALRYNAWGDRIGRTGQLYEWDASEKGWVLMYDVQCGDVPPWKEQK